MAKAKINNPVASIDIGSNYLRMTIAEVNEDGDFNILEDVSKQTNIGKDTFSFGRIKVETIHDICDNLKGFGALMRDYHVKSYKAIATSGIREAENKQYILEQIRLRTGIVVKCLNIAEERFFVLKGMKNTFSKIDIDFSKNVLVINITSGAIEASIYKQGQLKFTENIKIGSLRLPEILSELQNKSLNFPGLMEEYIESKIYLAKLNIENLNVSHFVAIGGELSTIIDIMERKAKSNEKFACIKRKNFISLYDDIRKMSQEQIEFDYDIPRKRANLVLSTVLLLQCFLKLTEAKEIYTPEITLRHGILKDISDNMVVGKHETDISDIISSVWHIGEKYKIDENHASYVEKIALHIFDETNKLHKLGHRERLYLQIASILHDVGAFINTTNHAEHSYNIIKTTDIIGFSDNELNIIANIARYHGDEDIRPEADENYYMLSEADRMTVSKLTAILKLSEALDVSHLQKIEALKVTVNSEAIYFNVEANEDILLEEWNFNNNAYFFEEVMGIKPII
ncbi:HD domain-containing protein [Clostridium sp. 19966]|uniref:Ppx/GppA phosphatase family protein n=1 Tax=Clostridium sp. 19966 TaxID=2768166 RepID=UPI0028DE6775|nr:HD domain-containing protein [Clostridium sp. 19966]MDT8717223.1 HD domain-containing protein [Clostridium sp. 19966]